MESALIAVVVDVCDESLEERCLVGGLQFWYISGVGGVVLRNHPHCGLGPSTSPASLLEAFRGACW